MASEQAAAPAPETAAIPMIPPPDLGETEPPAPPAASSEPQMAEVAPEPPPPPALEPEQAEAAPAPEPPPAPPAETAEAESSPPPPPPAPETATETVAMAEPAPASQAASEQTAALPPPTQDGESLRLTFSEGSAELNEAAKALLKTLAGKLTSDGNARVQLLAYASNTDDSTSRARRLSLSRALAVRAYLIDQGVRSTRMDVRALGSKSEGEPADRVDVLPARR